MENLTPDMQSIQDQPTEETPQPTQPISAARLAANRSNAKRSTGPRTPQGKLRSASNSMKHGLYSLTNFDGFIHNHDIALSVVTNYLDQFEPVTPTEVGLVHQLIHQQLRFLQMEFLFNQAMSFRVEDILKTPVTFLPHIMRELDRLPARIQRTIKAIRAEQKIRFDLQHDNENLEIEPIPDQPPLPPRSEQEFYSCAITPQGIIARDKLPKNAITKPLPQNPPTAMDAELLFRNFAERMQTKYGTYEEQLAALKLAEEAKKMGNEAKMSDPEKLK